MDIATDILRDTGCLNFRHIVEKSDIKRDLGVVKSNSRIVLGCVSEQQNH
jgi:hypothetical protein